MKIIISILIVISVLSCGGDKNSKKSNPEQSDSDTPKLKLLTLSEPQNEYMEALTSGTLMLDGNGCLKIGNSTLIWPYGYTLGENEKAIYNEKGDFVAEIGNQIRLSGGECSECPEEHVKKLTGIDSLYCTGNFWIIGEEISITKKNP